VSIGEVKADLARAGLPVRLAATGAVRG
jgi:hypothetical protein